MGKEGGLPRTNGLLLYHFFIIVKLTFVNNEVSPNLNQLNNH